MVAACACGERVRTNSDGVSSHAGLDPYDILGVSPDASADEIRRAYRRRARETHPDHGGNPDEFQAVQMAWEVLRDGGTTRARRRQTGSIGVPDVVGINAVSAISRLREAGLLPVIAMTRVDAMSPLIGIVVATTPSPGQPRPHNGAVQIVVALSDPAALRQRLIDSGRQAAKDLRSGFGTAWRERQPPSADSAHAATAFGQRLGYTTLAAARGTFDAVRLGAYAAVVGVIMAAAVVIGVIHPAAGLVVLLTGLAIIAIAWVRGQRRRRDRRERGGLL